MAIFTVHVPNNRDDAFSRAERTVFVRDGFSVAAFLFGPLYLLRFGAWVAAAAWIAILAAGFGLCRAAHLPVGVEVGLKAIAVMVIGGTTRIWGALVAGPLIGIAEVLTVAYGGSQVRDLVVYGLMILILLLRPQGILGGSRADQGQRV